jgi:hypothetical protein
MPEFGFRLRFNLAPAFRINSDAEELELLSLPSGERFRLRSAVRGTPIKNHRRTSLLGGPYSSSDLAHTAAEKAKFALLYWAVERRVGIDFGDGHPRGTFTREGLEFFRQQIGAPIRPDIHGIDVYELLPDLRFVMIDAVAEVGIAPANLIEGFGRSIQQARPLGTKQLLAVEVYSGSFFDESPRSRFITLVTAVGALLDPAPRSQSAKLLIENMEKLTRDSEIDNETKQSIIGSLQWLKAQSIGQAGRSLASHLLPEKKYDGRSAPSFFANCYNIRSQLVHNGRTERAVNMLLLANAMEQFVADLLLASINEAEKSDGFIVEKIDDNPLPDQGVEE